MDDENAMPATAEDFLELGRRVLSAKALPTQREVAIATAYTEAAKALAQDPAALPDLMCAHLRLCDALDETTPGPWRTQLGAAHTWLDIAYTAAEDRRRAARTAEQATAVTLPRL
jgi:hypothetical protein